MTTPKLKRSEIADYAAKHGCRVERQGGKTLIAPKGLKGFRVYQYEDGSMFDYTVDLSIAASLSTATALKLLRLA